MRNRDYDKGYSPLGVRDRTFCDRQRKRAAGPGPPHRPIDRASLLRGTQFHFDFRLKVLDVAKD